MVCVFDMRRLHHGCGESLLVRPLKPACIAKSGNDEQRQRPEKVRSEISHTETESSVRQWE